MSPSDGLYRAVCAAPHDDLPRLVYADWLEENGRPHRAEFIRVQCRLANASPAEDDYVDLLEREAELKAILWRELETDRPPLPAGVGWEPEHRGFAERLRFGYHPPDDLAVRVAGCSAGVPIGGLHFQQLPEGLLDTFVTHRLDVTVTSLNLHYPHQPQLPSGLPTSLHPLSSGQTFPHLRRLVLNGFPANNEFMSVVVTQGWRDLREVSLPHLHLDREPHCHAWAESVRVLSISHGLRHLASGLPHLHTLHIGRLSRHDAELFCDRLPALAALTTELNESRAPVFTGLGRVGRTQPAVSPPPPPEVYSLHLLLARTRPVSVLRVRVPHAGDEVERLLDAEWVKRLRIFDVNGTAASVGQAFGSKRFHDLRQLWVSSYQPVNLNGGEILSSACWKSITTLDAPTILAEQGAVFGLVSRVEAPHLRHLNLRGNPLGDAGAVALAGNASLANLTRLNVSGCRIGPRGVQALLESPHLQRLIELNLYANTSGDSVAALADPGVMPNLGLADVAANGVSVEVRRRLERRPAIRAK